MERVNSDLEKPQLDSSADQDNNCGVGVGGNKGLKRLEVK